jgi:uncharacterized protein (DUF58 family)
MFLVGILHSFANMSGLSVRFVRSAPVFTGETLSIDIMLSQKKSRLRDGIKLLFKGGEVTTVSFKSKENITAHVLALAPKRGNYNPGRLQIESVYPLGLLRVWTKVDLDIHCLVYPRPIFNTFENTIPSGRGEGALQLDNGSEDFVGLKDYQLGDSLKRIAWKQYARGQGMYAKHYADFQDERIWLDWDALPGLDRESRLSVLTGKLLKVAATDQHYGLKLPGIDIAPNSGEAHKYQTLKELALFEAEDLNNSQWEIEKKRKRKASKEASR